MFRSGQYGLLFGGSLSFIGRKRPLENKVDLIIKDWMGLGRRCDDYLRSIRINGFVCLENVGLLEIPVQQSDCVLIDHTG